MLFLITNRKIVKRGTFLSVIKNAVDGGVDAIVVREKDLDYDHLLKVAKEIKEIIRETKTLLIINRNLEVAKAIKADGYHIGFKDLMNEKIGFDGHLGVSVHSLEEAIVAEREGATYLLASHVFETDCKKGVEPRGISFIKEIKEHVNIPVIALGGIKLENMEIVFSTGIKGIAVMSAIMSSEDPYKESMKFKNKI